MKPDYLSIIEIGSERAVADLAVSAIESHPEGFKDVFDLCFLEKYPLSMRASRVIQLYCEKYPEAIYPFLDEAIDKTIRSKIGGVRRNFLKIFGEFIDINKIKDPGPLLNTCFDWILDRSVTPAIKIYAMSVIYNICSNEPDILRELAATIEIIMEESEISIKTCGSKMVKKINRHLKVSN